MTVDEQKSPDSFPKEKNVYRIDIDATNTHGWQVRITRQGCHFRKYFADHAHGGITESRDAAIEHRDFLLEELPALPEGEAAHLHTEETRRKAWKKLTRTGVKGLGYTMKIDNPQGKARPYASAYWSDHDGKRHSAQRSIIYHGVTSAVRQVAEVLAEESDHDLTPEEMVEQALPNIKKMLKRDIGPKRTEELLDKTSPKDKVSSDA
jgi:hypothetical protein